MNRSIFKAYDIRGIYPTDINEQTVSTISKALAALFDEGEIVLAHDARHGSPELMKVLESTLPSDATALGKKLTLRVVGLSTTPMFYFLVNHFAASGGCMITASHNPKEYNGIKVVQQKAHMVPGTKVLEIIDTLK
jgi:phosphomannomutase